MSDDKATTESDAKSDKSDGSFVKHARTFSLLTLLSRFFGLARDATLAWVFGFGPAMDAFVVAFMVPNLFRRLFGEGALAAAFIPQYTKLHQADVSAARRFAGLVLGWLHAILLSVCLLGVLVLAGGVMLDVFTGRGELTVWLVCITLWYAPLVCGTAILGAMLQVHHRFGPPAAAPVILNIAIIGSAFVGGYVLSKDLAPWNEPITWVAIAVILAGVIQLAWQFAVLRRIDEHPSLTVLRSRTDEDRGHLKLLLKQWTPTVLGLAVFQLNTLADALIAMCFSGPTGETMNVLGTAISYPMEVGAVGVLGATQRLYEFPLGVFGIAVATALFPALSAAAEDNDKFPVLLRQGLRLSFFIGLPATVGLMLIREPVARAIYYESGQLTAEDAQRIAWVLLGYAASVWAYSLNHVFTRAFYAKGNPVTPMRVSVLMVFINFTLNLTLIWPLGTAGLAWSTAVCAVVQCVVLSTLIHQRYVKHPVDRSVFQSWVRVAILTAIFSPVIWGVLSFVELRELSRMMTVVVILICVAIGGGTLFIGARVLRMDELRWVVSRRVKAD